MSFKKDVNLDAVLVHASMRGLFVPCTIGLGMKPHEAYGRAEWLKTQSKRYLADVSNRVAEIEKDEFRQPQEA